jgi:hypothetical protein
VFQPKQQFIIMANQPPEIILKQPLAIINFKPVD